MKKAFLFLFTVCYLLFTAGFVHAEDEFDKITKQIDDLKKQMEMSIAATVPLEKTLKDLDSQIAGIRAQVVNLSDQLEKRKAEVAEGEKAFALKEQILEKRVRSAYKSSYHVSCLLCQFISTEDVGTVLRVFTYQKSLADEDKRMVGEIIVYLADLDAKKKKIEQESTQLASLKLRIDEQADFFRTEIAGARNYQKQLGSQIAELTVRQQALLAAKTGLFSTSVGNVPLADDPASRPDYNPGFSPAFAAFSFGAPHFKGMSQYGAFGRAKEGQNAEDILRAYYGGGIEIKKDYSTDITIQVDGYGGYNIEEYTKRIY